MLNKISIIALAAAIVACIIAATVTASARHETEETKAQAEAARQAETEARKALEDCQRAAQAISQARQIEAKTIQETEIKKDEATAQFNEIRINSCHVDDDARLDQRVRELAIDAYRVAICTESTASDSTTVPATAGSGAP